MAKRDAEGRGGVLDFSTAYLVGKIDAEIQHLAAGAGVSVSVLRARVAEFLSSTAGGQGMGSEHTLSALHTNSALRDEVRVSPMEMASGSSSAVSRRGGEAREESGINAQEYVLAFLRVHGEPIAAAKLRQRLEQQYPHVGRNAWSYAMQELRKARKIRNVGKGPHGVWSLSNQLPAAVLPDEAPKVKKPRMPRGFFHELIKKALARKTAGMVRRELIRTLIAEHGHTSHQWNGAVTQMLRHRIMKTTNGNRLILK